MNKIYKQQVGLLLKIIPTLAEIDNFAIHSGTAINFYMLDLPRYSVDIDVTYIPITPREESFEGIHKGLSDLKEKIKSVVPDITITEKPNKIYCSQKGVMVKIEVSGTKKGTVQKNPFENVFTRIDKTVKRAVSEATITQLKNRDLSAHKELALFMFSFQLTVKIERYMQEVISRYES